MTDAQRAKCAVFAALHKGPGAFVIPNPYDVGSALYLGKLGFKALATSSAGAAWTLGKPDGGVSRDGMLAHINAVAIASPLPVSADFEACFGADEAGVAESVSLCVKAGVAGLSIEDLQGDAFFSLEDSLRRLAAARAAIKQSGMPVLLTARSEILLRGDPGGLKEALRRVTAFAAAGADVIYVPGVKTIADVKAVVDAVAPLPVNVLASMPFFTLRQLEDAGVRRVSVGSSLARSAWGGFMQAAREIATHGTFNTFAQGAPFAEVNALFGGGKD
jgi:2-methylisocitrate lyase-like PEP mutase family enzyme